MPLELIKVRLCALYLDWDHTVLIRSCWLHTETGFPPVLLRESPVPLTVTRIALLLVVDSRFLPCRSDYQNSSSIKFMDNVESELRCVPDEAGSGTRGLYRSATAPHELLEKRPNRRSHYFRSAHVAYIVYS
jgi:hypothetical protein